MVPCVALKKNPYLTLGLNLIPNMTLTSILNITVLNDTSKDGFAPDAVNVQKMKAHKSKDMKLGGVC
jgi:hypothetical protein